MKKYKKEKYKNYIILNELKKKYEEDNEYYYDDYYSEDVYFEFLELDRYPYFYYIYIPDTDVFSTNISRVKSNAYNGFLIYSDENDIIHINVSVYSANTKVEAFFGCVLKVITSSKKYSNKIKNIYNYLYDKYPEIYFLVIDKI